MSYLCDKFEKLGKEKVIKKKPVTTIIIKDEAQSNKLKYEHIVQQFNDNANVSPLPPDLKIDDRDLPLANNFLEFTTSPKFLNIKPYAKQLEIGLHTFGEICPNKRCTDWEYACDIPKKASVDDILERVTCLNHGKCPKCGYRKSEMLADGYKIPTKAAILVGQRCIVGDSQILTVLGLIPISKLVQNVEGFSDYTGPDLIIENNQIVTPSMGFMQHNQVVRQVTFSNGRYIIGTPEHPIKTATGYVHLKDLTATHIIYALTDNAYQMIKVVSNQQLASLHTVYDFHIPEYHRFIANGIMNHNSGKSKLAVMVDCYCTHGYLKLQNASQVFGLLKNQILECTLVALTAENARKLLYADMEDYLRHSPWFSAYNEMLGHYGQKYGEELYRIREMFASYRGRSLLIRASDPDMRKLRGPSRYCSNVDELGWFLSGKNNIKFDAKEILRSINNSMRSVKNSYYKLLKKGMDGLPAPMFFNISSPSSKKDLIVTEYNEAKNDNQAISFNYATWDFSPEYSKKDFAKELSEKPIETMRDYGAEAPNSSAPYISDISHIKGIVEKTRYNTAKSSPVTLKVPGGKIMGAADLRILSAKDNNRRILSIDAAYSENSFAIVCGYFDDVLQRPIFDTFIEIMSNHDTPLNFNSIFEDVICPLVEHLNVGIIVADRFQGKKFLDDTSNKYQIPSEIYSVKYDDFKSFKQDLLDHKVTIPRPEKKPSEIEFMGEDNYPYNFAKCPVAHFLFQIITVQDLRKEVIKGQGFTDDLFRATVLAYSYLVDPKYQEYCSGNSVQGVIAPKQFVTGVLSSRGSASLGVRSNAGTSSDSSIMATISSRGNSR